MSSSVQLIIDGNHSPSHHPIQPYPKFIKRGFEAFPTMLICLDYHHLYVFNLEIAIQSFQNDSSLSYLEVLVTFCLEITCISIGT